METSSGQWYVDPSILRPAIAAYPTLQAAIFPAPPTTLTPAQSQDITVYQLLQVSHSAHTQSGTMGLHQTCFLTVSHSAHTQSGTMDLHQTCCLTVSHSAHTQSGTMGLHQTCFLTVSHSTHTQSGTVGLHHSVPTASGYP